MRVRLRFTCTLKLPAEPKGRGHVIEASLDAVKGGDKAAEEASLRQLGKAAAACESKNVLELEVQGRHVVTCAFCGVAQCVLFGLPEGVVIRDVQMGCHDLSVEVVDGSSSA